MIQDEFVSDAEAMTALGMRLARKLSAGDVVLLSGPLGAGKTTLARAIALALGWDGPVRSPTFSLIQHLPTQPPLVHADLYRLDSAHGIGLEDVGRESLLLVEWPERDPDFFDAESSVQVTIAFEGEGRRVTVVWPPHRAKP
jgi:tRNA threonylcarbamoyladenosine biosynthesis protein TsaE